jgi:monofunctional biosynthetic peptidoglycan transglycosylase
VYLNIVETGSGVYGVEAASQKFFNKSASKLTKSQAALIAASLPNPRKFKIDNPSSYMLKRKAKILSVMRNIPKVKFNTEKDKE